ncbi:hypothetical protein GM661_10210 [Iocasia frigidifontis]|uniref:Uncharacterized protein n=1 Tax=Iocasia fonsfrigidae TaxID=2682810 RepID=A0A8A7KDZ3_9FIRM|nr:hypothetical protein [Iocasia fonsfrigidae]QTL98325.1 hypothetical protein GM661_10210 [Iocasia fonsfrigidae]
MTDINNIAEKVLSNTNSSVVKYKIMTEIIDTDKKDTEIKKLRKELNESKKVWFKLYKLYYSSHKQPPSIIIILS